MWVTDSEDDKIYAFKISDKSRDPSRDFNTSSVAGNMAIRGLWSDGITMWVADDGTDELSYNSDSGGNKLYTYHLPNASVSSDLSLSDGAVLTAGFDGAAPCMRPRSLMLSPTLQFQRQLFTPMPRCPFRLWAPKAQAKGIKWSWTKRITTLR